MRGVKIVLCYLLAIAAVIGLQMNAYTGIFLMMFLAVAWPALLFNTMLGHLAVEAVRRRIAIVWLLLPIAVYAAWGVYAAIDYRNAVRLRSELDMAASKIPKLSPAPREVLMQAADPRAAESKAAGFVKAVDGVRVFANGLEFLMIPSADRRCRWEKDSPVKIFGGAKPKPHETRAPYDRCVIATPEVAPDTAVMITSEPLQPEKRADKNIQRFKSGRDEITVEIPSFSSHTGIERLSSGQRTIFKRRGVDGDWAEFGEGVTGTISYAPPVPFFMAGCGLNSGNPSWDCFFGLWMQRMPVTFSLVEALGLPARQ
jgi:hypothetical protein